MPELPEVERTAAKLRENAVGKTITDVQTTEDSIVYTGITHEEFGKEIRGRKIINVGRYGKVFYIELGGKGRQPVLHFGMTGNIHIKGQVPIFYAEGPKEGEVQWPPRFMKFILHLAGGGLEEGFEMQIAFVDARRLGRIRLCKSPLDEPPISSLGFDPILCMPALDDFSSLVSKRGSPIKALLLDQSFSAGVGNWVADEILYQSRVHPEQRCNTLGDDQISRIYEKMKYVCETAVALNAEASKFPDDWLFQHRWGKGKRRKNSNDTKVLKLPSGESATIKWITVGGRTSAYVTELQKVKLSNVDGAALKIVKETAETIESHYAPKDVEEETRGPKRTRNQPARTGKKQKTS